MHMRSSREMRRQLAALIFDGAHDGQAFAGFGFDAAMPRIALAVDCSICHPDTARSESAHASLAQGIASHLRLAVEQVVYVTRCGRFIAWAPCACRNSPLRDQRALSEALERFASQATQVRAIGVGLANDGLRGWAESAQEAIAALDAVRRNRGRSTRVLPYSDIAIDKSVCSNESALRYFEAVLEVLVDEKDLIHTLQSYFDHCQHRKATAAALNIHPNTLKYRLNRIEALLGADLRAPSWIARLFTALKLHDATNADAQRPAAARTGTGVRASLQSAIAGSAGCPLKIV